MFEDAFFATVLEQLAEELPAEPAPPPAPLPADRWICRSALQKAIRRGDLPLALRAALVLLQHDARGFWRALIGIALEDLGVPELDLLAKIVAAAGDKPWRARLGGEWNVAAELLRQCCGGWRCQAVCDLFLKASYAPELASVREEALTACPAELARRAFLGSGLEAQAIAVLALTGGLPNSGAADAGRYFHRLEAEAPAHVTAISRSAWRISRSPLAVLMPIIWGPYSAERTAEVADDPLPLVRMLDEVPSFAVDQYTRTGLAAYRLAAAKDRDLGEFLAGTGAPKGTWPRLLGDLTFLVEGGLTTRRLRWPIAESLRTPVRQMPVASAYGDHVLPGIALVGAKAAVIHHCRQLSIPSADPLAEL